VVIFHETKYPLSVSRTLILLNFSLRVDTGGISGKKLVSMGLANMKVPRDLLLGMCLVTVSSIAAILKLNIGD
jgi:hypothetical protein